LSRLDHRESVHATGLVQKDWRLQGEMILTVRIPKEQEKPVWLSQEDGWQREMMILTQS
jgi:hypothetical protein